MPAPKPEPLQPEQLPQLARDTMRGAKFPVLATVDGDQPRVRPVSPVRTEGFTVFIANLRSYGKTKEIESNPKVELCYTDDGHNQVRITGTADVVTDRALLEDIWSTNPLMRAYLGSIDNPALIVYQVTPSRVRFMKEWALEYHEVPLSSS
jgi:general stress protein 26